MASKQINPVKSSGTTKFNLWLSYFSDRSNKECFGNATKSTLKAYNTTSYASAGVIGHENLKKLKIMRLAWLDMEGYGFGERMKIALAKALKGSYNDWHKFMVQVGEFEDKSSTHIKKRF